MRIAIVGTGVSGLVAAHLLHRRHEITVYEAAPGIGGHVHTVDVEVAGERHGIDTGFIVYNERTYPRFAKLLRMLEVRTRPSDMSFSVACERSGIEWASRSLGSVFAQRRNALRPSFRRMLGDVLRFNREVRELLETDDEKVALGDYLCGAGYSDEFVEHYILPLGAAIWSASPRSFLRFPAASFVRFFENHGLLQRDSGVHWRVVEGGSREYVRALVAPFADRIRTGCPVSRILRNRRGVEVASRAGIDRFDRVVLATHSDQALRLLMDASPAERHVLGAIRYQRNQVLLHTDPSVMPRLRRAWASWNYRVPAAPSDRVFVTYHMNRLQGLRSAGEFFVTLNGMDAIAEPKILGRFEYDHPIFDGDALAAQKLHDRIDGSNRTHYCGAYWGYGFHEDGVRSALATCRKLGGGLR